MVITDRTENVSASNWRAIYFCHGTLGNLTFNEMCYFIINEFFEADIIKIERDEQMIRIHFPSPYSYADILKKTDQYRYQIIILIDIDEEEKIYNMIADFEIDKEKNNNSV